MPAQRGHRGSYAKYICTHCRSRKIKCILPENVEIGLQSTESSCQRCIAKGLDCVVDFTTLGRPSQTAISASGMTRLEPSPGERVVHRERGHGSPDDVDEDQDASGVDDYLVVRPERTTGSENADPSQRGRHLRPMDKFRALASPVYLLSTLLERDKLFASKLQPKNEVPPDLNAVIDINILPVLDRHLVWHRLYYPDLPSLPCLYEQLSVLHPSDWECTATAFLLSLLCSLALDVSNAPIRRDTHLRQHLDGFLFHFGQRVLFSLPEHRYAFLGLELMEEYKPLALTNERNLACEAVRNRIISSALKQIAEDLDLNCAMTRLKVQLEDDSADLDMGLMYDCLKWYRLRLRNEILSNEDSRIFEIRESLGRICYSDRLPTDFSLGFHLVLCEASKLEHLLRIKQDWTNLESLGTIIEEHRTVCERQKQQLKDSIDKASPMDHHQKLAMTQLLDMQLHSAFCSVSGSATFYCIMSGSGTEQSTSTVQPEQALQVSNQIIQRFAKPTRHLQASEPHTAFLIKYGTKRMDDLELALSNYISSLDSLKLDGIVHTPPMRKMCSGVLYTVKDVMEGQAARMKGWGGLHGRSHMHLLLIRDCANSLGRLGAAALGGTCSERVAKGCLWTATARILRSLHRLLAQWKEWEALGQAKVDIPEMDMAEMELLPDEMFFDWSLWARDFEWASG